MSEAIDAYDAGRYRQALDAYTDVQLTAAGHQFRVYNGVGSARTLIATGKDDASDALDRRVEFAVIDCWKA